MTEEALQGTCEDCGKVYKVPSADRTYTCKACGGTVSVYDEEEEDFDDDELEEDEYDDDEYEEDEEDEDEDEEDDEDDGRHRASDRLKHLHGRRDSSKSVWIAMAAVLGLGAVVFFMHAFGVAPWSDKGEIDLDVVNESFAVDWAAADLDAIASYYHPHARTPFRENLAKFSGAWGWDDGFDPITEKTSSVKKNSSGDPTTGESKLKFGDGEEATLLWQYEKGPNKWYIYDFETTPPPIDKLVEEFRTAWALSNPDSLRSFFRPEGATKMIGLVQRAGQDDGWKGNHPVLGEHTAVLDDEGRMRVTYTVPGSDFLVKFKFSNTDYAWYISGFRFP